MRTLDYLNLNEARVANVVTALQNLLADFQVYYTNLRGFHWEIKGRGFFVLHEKFESMYDDTATKVDEIAERILTLGGAGKGLLPCEAVDAHFISLAPVTVPAVQHPSHPGEHDGRPSAPVCRVTLPQIFHTVGRPDRHQLCAHGADLY